VHYSSRSRIFCFYRKANCSVRQFATRSLADWLWVSSAPSACARKARHFGDSHQHRERLFIVAIRNGAEALLGTFEFPSPNTASRSAQSVLVPLPIFEGERFSSTLFRACPPLRYFSGLIKAGRGHSSSHSRMHCVERRGPTADAALCW
jgi:hypothetical protein